MSLLLLAGLALIVAITVAAARKGANVRTGELREAARDLKLSLSKKSSTLSGRSGQFGISIEFGDGPTRSAAAKVDLGAHSLSGGTAFQLRRFADPFVDERAQTGDAEFDERMVASGPEPWLTACLNERARKRTLNFAAEGGSVESGVLLFSSGVERARPDLVRLGEAALMMASCLLVEDIPRALKRSAKEDSIAGVRARNLEMLARHHPKSPECARALQTALGDRAAEVLVASARILGPAAYPALTRLVGNKDEDASIRSAAVAQLVADRGKAAMPQLCLALRSPDEQLRLAGTRSFLALLEELPEVAQNPELREAFFRADDAAIGAPLAEALSSALAKIDDARSERSLIAFLSHESTEVRIAAASSLAIAGTVGAVEPLLELSRGGLLHRRASEAARNAVRAIQQRLGDVSEGGVSIATSDLMEGAVSLAPEPGAVSIAPRGDKAREPR